MILAKDLIGNVLRNHVEVLEEFPGSELIGKAYTPLFPGAVDGTGWALAYVSTISSFVVMVQTKGSICTCALILSSRVRFKFS